MAMFSFSYLAHRGCI